MVVNEMNDNIINFIRKTSELWLSKVNKVDKKREELKTLFQEIEKISRKKEEWLNQKLIKVPSLIVINVTTRCNLSCIGCYFEKERNKGELKLTEINEVILQAKQMGVFLFVFIGGEPFLRPDLIDLMSNHRDVIFLIFSNATKIAGEAVRAIAKMSYHIPLLLSIEGSKEDTDERRGLGVHDTVIEAMKIFKEKDIFFGFSVTVTKKNFHSITTYEFMDEMIAQGCQIGWYTDFILPNIHLKNGCSLGIDDKIAVKERINRLRAEKKISLLHFPADEGGNCQAGRELLYINYDGSVAPCPFLSYNVGNIKEQTLEEILNGNTELDRIPIYGCNSTNSRS